jgi:hypothetical protein
MLHAEFEFLPRDAVLGDVVQRFVIPKKVVVGHTGNAFEEPIINCSPVYASDGGG